MPHESLYPPIEIPNTDVWGLLFEQNDTAFPSDKGLSTRLHQNLLLTNSPVIFVDAETNKSYTFDQVKKLAVEFGKGLKAVWDWQKGDVMALFTPNNIDVPPFIWGVHWAGGICSPANPAYTVDELAFLLGNCDAKAIGTEKQYLSVVIEAARKVNIPEDRIILVGDARDDSMRFKHFTSIVNIAGTSRYRRTKMNPQKDLAFLVYSSGTTGLPKGVMLTHANIVSNILMGKVGEGGNLSWDGGTDGQGDKLLAFLPFFHIYGLTCLIHQAMYNGLTLVVMAKFDLAKFCAVIQEHKITFAYIVPPVVLLLGKHPVVDQYDLSSLRMMNSGAAPLTRELVDSVYKRLKIPLKQGYGLSETSPTTHTQPWHLWDKPVGSIGTLLPNQIAKFMSAEEEEVAVEQSGELWIKGPNVFQGYFKNAEATRNAFSADGFFKTGDIGHLDKDGNYYITDRLKELIKYKGFQVAPAELEGLLLSHPMINDVAVVGIYDKDIASEVPRAYVVVKAGVQQSKQTAEDILSWLNGKVANAKRLRGGIIFVGEIPKSASGKILRRLLKAKAQEDEAKGIKAKL